MMKSQRRSVLFMSPRFFGYEVSIKEAIEENGFEVDFFDERTSNNSLLKAIFRVNKAVLGIVINIYYKNILKKIKDNHYDFFFLIKGEVVPEWFIVSFKDINPAAKLIYYTYDSFKNNNANSTDILKFFDAAYSFDFNDVERNRSLKLKHLFFTKEFIVNPETDPERVHSISFVGTLHSNRYQTVKNLFKNFDNTFVYYFLPAKWFFALEKLYKKHFREINWSEVSFNKLTKQEVANIFKASKSVVDIQRFGQSGLTMRTFEVLASGAVLITTNPSIKWTDFYYPDKVIVLDNNNFLAGVPEIKAKLEKAAGEPPSPIKDFERYFVNNWVKEFFE